MSRRETDLIDGVLGGDHRALARAITRIENREPGYRDLVSALYPHAGGASVVGVTGSPGAGKSTLVDALAGTYREREETVGIVAVDPSSPYSGGAVLGDRIRMGSTVGDMDVFVRSMSARGQLGGVATATTDAVTALDAFGKDRIVVETVGAGQNEVDIVRTADTVVVLVQPGSGDDVQMLKAGILEIGDVFVVNKADKDGSDRLVADLEEMLHLREDGEDGRDAGWEPRVIETVATTGEGVAALVDALDDHREHLESSGRLAEQARTRHAAEIRRLLRADLSRLVEDELDSRGGVEDLAAAVARRETDPYAIADRILDPIAECVEGQTEPAEESGRRDDGRR